MRGTTCAGRDIGIHELTLVGVFPVMDGYAHLDLRAVAGKGRTQYNPLYIIPGEAVLLTMSDPCQRCVSLPHRSKPYCTFSYRP